MLNGMMNLNYQKMNSYNIEKGIIRQWNHKDEFQIIKKIE